LALRIDCPIFVEDEVLKCSKSKENGQDRLKDEDLRRLLENISDEDLGRYKM
jgi:bifunctional DNase/RNase